jgi:hypothetical protein
MKPDRRKRFPEGRDEALAEWRRRIVSFNAPISPEMVRPLVGDLEGKPWGPLADAFDYFGLDSKNPSHRDLLLFVLASEVFGKRPGRGRPRGSRTWDWDQLFDLGMAYFQVMARRPEISDREAATEIKGRAEYQHIEPDTIRQRLPEARKIIALVWQARRLVDNS